MEAFLAPAGVFVLQAHHPTLKHRSLPLLLRELRECGDRETALREGAEAMRREGFALQVPLLEGATNLLFEGGEGRERLFVEGDGFRLRGSERRITLHEIEAAVAEDPSLLSPNVLLRPVVESALLPTLSYVGGGGEVAYWGQNGPLFRAAGIAPPIVHPRASFVLVEKKIDKVLQKFGLEIGELARPPHELLAGVLRDALPSEAAGTLHNLRAAIEFGFEEVRNEAGKIDPTLRGAIDSPKKRSVELIDEVEKKLLQSVRRSEEVSLDQVAKAQAHLYPNGLRQERILNPFYYLMRYGDDLLRELHERAREAVLP
jgi:bacillithiol biosynthesis cysteine-adding enzyme BshC